MRERSVHGARWPRVFVGLGAVLLLVASGGCRSLAGSAAREHVPGHGAVALEVIASPKSLTLHDNILTVVVDDGDPRTEPQRIDVRTAAYTHPERIARRLEAKMQSFGMPARCLHSVGGGWRVELDPPFIVEHTEVATIASEGNDMEEGVLRATPVDG